jgi:hypothetical protein
METLDPREPLPDEEVDRHDELPPDVELPAVPSPVNPMQPKRIVEPVDIGPETI